MIGPCHSAREQHNCDLNLGRSSEKVLPGLGGRGLEAALAPCDVPRPSKKILFSGLGVIGKSR